MQLSHRKYAILQQTHDQLHRRIDKDADRNDPVVEQRRQPSKLLDGHISAAFRYFHYKACVVRLHLIDSFDILRAAQAADLDFRSL